MRTNQVPLSTIIMLVACSVLLGVCLTNLVSTVHNDWDQNKANQVYTNCKMAAERYFDDDVRSEVDEIDYITFPNVVDQWDRPTRRYIATTTTQKLVVVQSSGPDGRFNNPDDITVVRLGENQGWPVVSYLVPESQPAACATQTCSTCPTRAAGKCPGSSQEKK